MAEKDYSATPLTTKLGATAGSDVLVYFTTSRAQLARRFGELKETLAPADGLWIAYPKKSSSIETDLTFDAVQQIGLAAGLVDNKSIAFDDEWSAVRFVYRRRDR
jgi:4-diphosphocytidyl-2C-methyl-D-erythritol kinase